MYEFVKMLKNVRKNLILSQKELAEYIGVSFSTINRWENGHCEPSIKAQKKIYDFCKEKHINYKMNDYSRDL